MGYREELKSRAKACLRNYYWAAVVVVLLTSVLRGEEWLGSSQQMIAAIGLDYYNFSASGGFGIGNVLYEAILIVASAYRRKYVEYIVPDISVRGASAKRRRSGRYD